MAEQPDSTEKGMPGRFARTMRWLRMITLLSVLGGLVMAVDWFIDPSVSPLRVARIEGDLHHLKRAELEQAVADTTQAGFFTVDVQAVKQAAEALPWVAKASVRRVWPDTLHLWVVEQAPLARWGKNAVLNQQGEVFNPAAATIPAALPRLHGPAGSGPELALHYRQARDLLRGIDMVVKRLEMSARYSWRLELDSGTVVQLGQEGFEQRLKRFVKLYPMLRESRSAEIRRVDMRYYNGMAILWGTEKVDAGPVS